MITNIINQLIITIAEHRFLIWCYRILAMFAILQGISMILLDYDITAWQSMIIVSCWILVSHILRYKLYH